MEEGTEYINNTVKAVVIISGKFGKMLVPRIHHMENIIGIIVFCFKESDHLKWSVNYEKVKHVVSDGKKISGAIGEIL